MRKRTVLGIGSAGMFIVPLGFGVFAQSFMERVQDDMLDAMFGIGPKADSEHDSVEPEVGAVFKGKARVVDGDTVELTTAGQASVRVRVDGIDAPETDQPAMDDTEHWVHHGQEVRAELEKKIDGREITVEMTGVDRYGRMLGVVRVDGEDLGAWLVRNGHAVSAYTPTYESEQREAEGAKRGLWAYAEAYEPSAWRRGTRQSLIDPSKPATPIGGR